MKRVLSFILVLSFLFTTASAYDGTTTERIDYEDGSYAIITLTKAGPGRAAAYDSKTYTFVNPSGQKCFTYTLYATFYYDGMTSRAESCNFDVLISHRDWSLDSHSEYPVGNKAVGTAYFRGPTM